MRYFKARWNESRGDAFASWGCSWWFFETDDAGNVLRQIEKFDNGATLRYDESHDEDKYGGLSLVALSREECDGCDITADEFESEWGTPGALNRVD